MRTSVLGIHDFGNIDGVISNTMAACKVTHADPRCIASCIAVTTAVAIMLQGKHMKQTGEYDVEAVVKEAYEYACTALESKQEVIVLQALLGLDLLLVMGKEKTHSSLESHPTQPPSEAQSPPNRSLPEIVTSIEV